jgi:predicted nucleotidyltransferase
MDSSPDIPDRVPAFVRDSIAELRSVAKEHGVRSVALIGSAARGTFDPSRSDLDLLVDFGEFTPDLGRRALAFYREVQALFRCRVDVVSVHGVRSAAWRSIHAQSQVPLYAAA